MCTQNVLASVALPPAWLAAVLLLGRGIAHAHGLECPSGEAIVTATGASKSQAYDIASKIATVLPTLVRAPGRPAHVPSLASPGETVALTRAVLVYVMAHPGCVDRGAQKNRYSEAFRRFILGLRAQHDIDLDTFALGVGIPTGTLKDWLRSPPPPSKDTTETPPSTSPLSTSHIQTVIDAYSRWQGSFLDFCEHVRRDLHVPFGRDLVRRVLETDGQRKPASRDGRTPDELALRGSFRTYFPGAQWVGDGMQVPVVVDEHRFVFNLELDVDAHTGAFVGASLRDNEDSAAVVDAFHSGVATTGAPPIALLLGKPSANGVLNGTPDRGSAVAPAGPGLVYAGDRDGRDGAPAEAAQDRGATRGHEQRRRARSRAACRGTNSRTARRDAGARARDRHGVPTARPLEAQTLPRALSSIWAEAVPA